MICPQTRKECVHETKACGRDFCMILGLGGAPYTYIPISEERAREIFQEEFAKFASSKQAPHSPDSVNNQSDIGNDIPGKR